MNPTLVLKAKELAKHAQKIAHATGCYVVKAAPNPTLERHGLVKAARWHLLTHSEQGETRRAVADLYVLGKPKALDIARRLSRLLNRRLDLLDNRATPRELAAHPATVVSRRRGNPAPPPVPGEHWRGPGGERVKITAVGHGKVTVLSQPSGDRRAIDALEFRSVFQPSRARMNPSRRGVQRAARKLKRVLRGPSRRAARSRTHAQAAYRALAHGRRLLKRGFHGPSANPKGRKDPRTTGYPGIGTPVVGTITVKGTTYDVHRMSSKYTPWYLVGPRGAQFGLLRYHEKPWLFYAINAARPTGTAGKLEGVTFTGETFEELAVFTDAGPRMNPSRTKTARARRKAGRVVSRRQRRSIAKAGFKKSAQTRHLIIGQIQRGMKRGLPHGRPRANPKGRIVAFIERKSYDPETGAEGVLRTEWRIVKTDYDAARAWAGPHATIGPFMLEERYIRRGVAEPWRMHDTFATRAKALDGLPMGVTAVASDLKRITEKRADAYSKRMATEAAQRANESAALTAQARRHESNQAFVRLLHSKSERHQQLAHAWNDVMAKLGTVGATRKAILGRDAKFRALYDAVIDAVTMPAKAKAIAAFMKGARSIVLGPRRVNPGGPRIVYNKLLGGWYVVTGPHQKPLNGRFDSKAAAQAWLSGRRANPKRRNPRIPVGARFTLYGWALRGGRLEGWGTIREKTAAASKIISETDTLKSWPHTAAGAHAADAWSLEMNRAEGARVGNPKGRFTVRRIEDEVRSPGVGSYFQSIFQVVDSNTGRTVFQSYNQRDARTEAAYRNKHDATGGTSHKAPDHPAPRRNPKGHLPPHTITPHGREVVLHVWGLDYPFKSRKIALEWLKGVQRGIDAGYLDPPRPIAQRLRNPKGRKQSHSRTRGGQSRTAFRARARTSARTPRVPNPSPTARAAAVVRKFQDRGPLATRVKKMKAPTPLKGVAAELGKLVAITYRTSKFDGKSRDYEHEFPNNALPSLVTDPDGRSLHVAGGRYQITPDGIVN